MLLHIHVQYSEYKIVFMTWILLLLHLNTHHLVLISSKEDMNFYDFFAFSCVYRPFTVVIQPLSTRLIEPNFSLYIVSSEIRDPVTDYVVLKKGSNCQK